MTLYLRLPETVFCHTLYTNIIQSHGTNYKGIVANKPVSFGLSVSSLDTPTNMQQTCSCCCCCNWWWWGCWRWCSLKIMASSGTVKLTARHIHTDTTHTHIMYIAINTKTFLRTWTRLSQSESDLLWAWKWNRNNKNMQQLRKLDMARSCTNAFPQLFFKNDPQFHSYTHSTATRTEC